MTESGCVVSHTAAAKLPKLAITHSHLRFVVRGDLTVWEGRCVIRNSCWCRWLRSVRLLTALLLPACMRHH